jgi:hypothetical protein
MHTCCREVQVPRAVPLVHNPTAVGPVQVHDQVHTIGQHVPPQNLENIHIRFHMLFSEGLNYK